MGEKSSEGLECERFGEGWPLLIYSMHRMEVLQAGASSAFPALKTPSLETFLQVLAQFSWLVLSLLIFLIFENSILKLCTHLETNFKTNLISLKLEHTCYYTSKNTGQKNSLCSLTPLKVLWWVHTANQWLWTWWSVCFSLGTDVGLIQETRGAECFKI